MRPSRAYLVFPSILFLFFVPIRVLAGHTQGIKNILNKMEAAYEEVKDYQAKAEVRTYSKDGSFETQAFLYNFKKPKWIRLDFESPYSGMILVYPDENGKVVVRPSGVTRFIKFHLTPDNFLIKVPSGQRIDQTDLGLLIRNISHSLGEGRRGPVETREDNEQIEIRVLADNHFRRGLITLYRFSINKRLWLPVRVEESNPDGQLERMVIFRNLRTNIGIPDSLFRLDGG